MSLLDRLKESNTKVSVKKRTTDSQILDAIMVEKYLEICNALESGYSWLQVCTALKEELETKGIWRAHWGFSKIHSSYSAYRRFKAIEEAGLKYEKGKIVEEEL